MMEIEIRWKTDKTFHDETVAMWANDIEWLVNPDRQPTEQELAECPKLFTCYSCGEKHPKGQLGGRYHGKWFCSGCIPYIDEWTAGAMLSWELNRKKQTYWSPRSTRASPTKVDRLEKMVEAVNWARNNGYTLP